MQSFFSALPCSRTLRQLGSIACAALLLAACSSGGGEGGGGTPPVAAPLAGVVIDSPIAGLGYNAVPSGLGGVTNSTGQFNYRPGDTLTFNIGGRPVGNPVPGAPVITGLMLFGATSPSDARVVNLAQLLLTLSIGGIPAGQNPITLPATIPAGLPNQLDFSIPDFDTVIQAALPAGTILVSEAAATTHLQGQFSTVSVTLAGAGSGSVASNPAGINCGLICSNGFLNGSPVTLTATGAGFAGWSVGMGNAAVCNGATGVCAFTPTSDSSITATFNVPPPPALTTSTAGTGSGTVACSTGGLFAPCALSYPAGTQVTIQATANAGSIFTVWTNGTGNATSCNNTGVDCVVTLNADSTVTATFDLPVMNSVTANTATASGGGGTVQCSANGGAAGSCGSYLGGTQIVMTATPNSASNFTGWSATVCSGTGTCNFTVIANTTVTANFNRPTLTVRLAGTGTVTSDVGGINCGVACSAVLNKGTVVTLTASGAGFSGWSGGGCSGTGTCPVTLNTNTTVTATFGVVSAAQHFKFIAAPGNQLLAINPQTSPATPTAVQVNVTPITLPNFGTFTGDGARLIPSATSYDAGTTSFLGIKEDTIIFTSAGTIYKASTLLSNGVPGVAGTNVPQQVSSLTTAKSCGMGSTGDLTNTSNRLIGFQDAGADSACETGDDFIVLMHLNDGPRVAPVSLPVGTTIDGDNFAALNLATGALSRLFLTNTAGNLQVMDTTLAAPTNVTGGPGIGGVEVVGQQADKVFLASRTRLYIYTPSTNTLSAPVVTADAGQTWVAADDTVAAHATTSTAIYLVQTNGAVYRVPLTTTAGQTVTTKHFTAAGGTIAGRIAQTPGKIMILTGTNPFGPGGQRPCATTTPTTCNNGIIAVDKTAPNTFVTIEAATTPKTIFFMTSWDNFVTYSFFDGSTGGSFAQIEDASSLAVKVSFGSWSRGTRGSSLNITTFADRTPVNQTISESSGPSANGLVIKVTTSPIGPTATIGTVSDPTNSLNSFLFFRGSVDGSLLGFANFAANPANRQPFLVDTTLNSLTKITTPGVPAPWGDTSGD